MISTKYFDLVSSKSLDTHRLYGVAIRNAYNHFEITSGKGINGREAIKHVQVKS